MALYEFAITIPRSTAEGVAVTTTHLLTPGVITKIEVQFPSGCGGLVHAQIRREGSQLWPNNPDSNAQSDGYVVGGETEVDITDRPYSVDVRAWNDDDTYQHTLAFRYYVRPAQLVAADRENIGILGRLAKLLGL